MSDEPLITSRQLAEKLCVTPETVRRWVRAGRALELGERLPDGLTRLHLRPLRIMRRDRTPRDRAAAAALLGTLHAQQAAHEGRRR